MIIRITDPYEGLRVAPLTDFKSGQEERREKRKRKRKRN